MCMLKGNQTESCMRHSKWYHKDICLKTSNEAFHVFLRKKDQQCTNAAHV